MPPIIVDDLLPDRKLAARRGGDDARWPRCPARAGNVTPSARPSRVCSSERLSPKAFTRISTQPGRGSGIGQLADLQRIRRAGRVQDDGAHRGVHTASPFSIAVSRRVPSVCSCCCSSITERRIEHRAPSRLHGSCWPRRAFACQRRVRTTRLARRSSASSSRRDQPGRLNPVDELAGRPHRNAQGASDIPDPHAAVRRMPDEVQRLKECERQVICAFNWALIRSHSTISRLTRSRSHWMRFDAVMDDLLPHSYPGIIFIRI